MRERYLANSLTLVDISKCFGHPSFEKMHCGFSLAIFSTYKPYVQPFLTAALISSSGSITMVLNTVHAVLMFWRDKAASGKVLSIPGGV